MFADCGKSPGDNEAEWNQMPFMQIHMCFTLLATEDLLSITYPGTELDFPFRNTFEYCMWKMRSEWLRVLKRNLNFRRNIGVLITFNSFRKTGLRTPNPLWPQRFFLIHLSARRAESRSTIVVFVRHYGSINCGCSQWGIDTTCCNNFLVYINGLGMTMWTTWVYVNTLSG